MKNQQNNDKLNAKLPIQGVGGLASLRSATSTMGRRMAGARALWRANGMKNEQMGKPLIAIVNSFTQFVPGHVHLHDIGQQVKAEIE